jgi:type I restriction enzyme S subunit
MNAQQLKNSILQMAVQGKLVPQDPKDEPASVLVEKIRAEKERLVKAGKIKREKPLPKITDDEIPFEVPESWMWVRLGSIGTFIRGSGIKRVDVQPDGVFCVRYGEIYTTYNIAMTVAISCVSKQLAMQSKPVVYGDLLMTLTGETKEEIGKTVAFLGNEQTVIGGDVATFTNHQQNPMYLSYLMNSPYAIHKKALLSTGDIIVHISCEKLASILVPIPPLAEQRRIVQRIEELLPFIEEYDKKEQALTAINATFPDRLKKSILQSAMQGKLVPQDPNDEPASVLVEKIRAEKERLIKAGKVKKEKPLPDISEDEIPFEVPKSWEWCRLGDVFHIIMGQSPDGKSVNEFGTGIEFHQGKVFFGERVLGKSNQITTEPTKIAPVESILLCVRAPVGKVNITDRKICIGRGLCAVVPIAGISLEFVFRLLETYELTFVKQATGTTFVAITGEVVKNQLVPIPPLAEQHRIVTKIEKLLTLSANL